MKKSPLYHSLRFSYLYSNAGYEIAEQYLLAFRKSCYQENELVEDLELCSGKALEELQTKGSIQSVFDKMDSKIDFKAGSISDGSDLSKMISNNIQLEENSLPIVPSVRINDRVIMVFFQNLIISREEKMPISPQR